VLPTADPALDDTVASVASAGFRDRESGRVRRTLATHVYRYQAPEPGPDPEPESKPAQDD
jgi:hypothetical protein